MTLKIISKTAFDEMTTVYGGIAGIKLVLKNEIIESVYHFEDSEHELLSMEIPILYINRKNCC